MDDLLKQVGYRILSRRKQLRMTQEELAEKAGITPQTVSSAELGKKALRPENIIRISSALGISTDYLLLGEINACDHSTLISKISNLSPIHYQHLEDIINSFIAALECQDTQGAK
ncbi:helix-turn-helix domain-containing protein [Acetatifactor aquisgranensis]|jgi:transcriptional regulator with XRE-family HTH domain|uniref:helix-turn-helix domain-containing protein n=1 Tax=Acetatifactor aquisgranensis TaxID=2941233 RepID=UPI0020418963|nr:helix-turn-helix transcriptional regulator [Acetatifactor aquisgranensis]